MSVAKGYHYANGWSGGEIQVYKAVYDFAVDGGAVSVIDLIELQEAMVIHGGIVKVKTLCTSGGSATVELGIKAGDTDAVLAATAVASLTANAVFSNAAASTDLYVASGAIISMEIKVAALTAGKIEVELQMSKF